MSNLTFPSAESQFRCSDSFYSVFFGSHYSFPKHFSPTLISGIILVAMMKSTLKWDKYRVSSTLLELTSPSSQIILLPITIGETCFRNEYCGPETNTVSQETNNVGRRGVVKTKRMSPKRGYKTSPAPIKNEPLQLANECILFFSCRCN